MSTSTWVQMKCDHCMSSDYYPAPKYNALLCFKDAGWITYKGKHFDTQQCLDAFKLAEKSNAES